MTGTLAKTAAGSKLFIGGSNPTADPADLLAESSWEEVGEVTNIPEFGLTYGKAEHKPLSSRQTYKFKTSFDGGSVQIDMADAPSDDGQAALVAALDADGSLNFKVEFNDAPAGASAHPTRILFMGKVFSYRTNVGTTEGIIAARSMIEIDGKPIRQAAATS
jgi:hypothetical protein